MIFLNTWRKFEERYLYNLMDCNGHYRIGIHVLQKKGDIESAIDFVKKIIGKNYNCQFECMELAEGFGDYNRDTVIDIVIEDEDEAKEMIKHLKLME